MFLVGSHLLWQIYNFSFSNSFVMISKVLRSFLIFWLRQLFFALGKFPRKSSQSESSCELMIGTTRGRADLFSLPDLPQGTSLICPQSSMPDWQYLCQRSPEGASSAICTKQQKIKEKEMVKSMSKQKKPKSCHLISVEKVQSQLKISHMYYFSSENSKIWVSTENTLCINCHILNFEGL